MYKVSTETNGIVIAFPVNTKVAAKLEIYPKIIFDKSEYTLQLSVKNTPGQKLFVGIGPALPNEIYTYGEVDTPLLTLDNVIVQGVTA